jgi:uncharacterized membrane protein
MPETAPSQETVVAVSFADRDKAHEALTRLRDLESREQVSIEALALVTRADDGHLVEDHLSGAPWAGRAGGGLVGVLIGILGGPLGMLLGGSAGLLIGAVADGQSVDESDSVLGNIANAVPIGRTAILAELVERDTASVDAAMSPLGGKVVRRSVDDVQAEVAAAEQAQKTAEAEARKHLRHARHEMRKTEVHAKFAEMKARLHRERARVTGDS